MQTLTRILCLLTIILCLAALDVTAKSSKKSEKVAKSAKQKKDSPTAQRGKNRREKETAAKNAKTDKKGKKGDRQKEVAESKHGRDKKDSRNRKDKERIADDKKRSRSEAIAQNRPNKGEREKPSGKKVREVVADNRAKANRASKDTEQEQTRPRMVKGSRDKEDSTVPSESSHLPKKSLSASPLPAAQNEPVGLMENRTSKGESKLLLPRTNSRDAEPSKSLERIEGTKLAPAPSAKNQASSATLSKPVEAQPELHSLSNESSRVLPQPQVSVVKPPLVTSPSTPKAPTLQNKDEARLTPGTGQLTKPEQSLSGDDTQSNPPNSRGGISTERVLEIQKALIKRGYLEDEGATGVYDETTRQAMKRFQMANNLSASGLPSAHALKKLGVSKRPDNGYAVSVKSSASADRKP